MPTPSPKTLRDKAPFHIFLRPKYPCSRPCVLWFLLLLAVLERLEGVLLIIGCKLAHEDEQAEDEECVV